MTRPPRRPGRTAALCLALATGLAACAPETLRRDEPLTAKGREIAPYEFHEECGVVVAGERIDYRFSSTRPVHFEIYYKEGVASIAPLSRDDLTEDRGIFPPHFTQRYCVRWDVGREGAIVDYRIRILPPPAS